MSYSSPSLPIKKRVKLIAENPLLAPSASTNVTSPIPHKGTAADHIPPPIPPESTNIPSPIPSGSTDVSKNCQKVT